VVLSYGDIAARVSAATIHHQLASSAECRPAHLRNHVKNARCIRCARWPRQEPRLTAYYLVSASGRAAARFAVLGAVRLCPSSRSSSWTERQGPGRARRRPVRRRRPRGRARARARRHSPQCW
jgi:hypothetical protein